MQNQQCTRIPAVLSCIKGDFGTAPGQNGTFNRTTEATQKQAQINTHVCCALRGKIGHRHGKVTCPWSTGHQIGQPCLGKIVIGMADQCGVRWTTGM